MARAYGRRTTRVLAAVLLAGWPASLGAQAFRPDDPLPVDRDDAPVAKPAPVELSTAYDVIEHTFFHRPQGPLPPAMNVNTLGEVPDSSWFTNRMGRRAMDREELARGPAVTGPPDVSQPLTVIAAKSGGITPGFTVKDAQGRVYFVKFDPAAHPSLSTAADVIGSRFFHAFGYGVPENYVASLRREQLRIDPEARVRSGGKRRPLTDADLDRSLANAYRLPDGRVRVVASLRLSGEPLGPFKYHGTRPDDANDVFPHEHRRELRGLRLFAAWLNHDDSRSVNTHDMYVPGAVGRHVRHHLIDFSSTLGSGSNARREIAPQNPRGGNEYVIELGPALRSAFSLGLLDRRWRKVRYETHPGVGNFEADFFRPEAWRPEYPNPAFERMRLDDAFWAARIISTFDDDAVRALVKTGEIGGAASERHLADMLIRRRDKIVAHYFDALAPLHEFAVRAGANGQARLLFRNLGEAAGLGRADGYEHEWAVFDNATARRAPLAPPAVSPLASLPVPATDAGMLVVRIRTRAKVRPAWLTPVEVFLRRVAGAWEVVGVNR